MSDRGEYRSIRTVLIDGPDYQSLTPECRLVFITLKLQLGPTGLGVINAAKHTLADQTGYSPEVVASALETLQRHDWIRSERNVFEVVGGLNHEPSISSENPNHRKSVRNYVAGLPNLRIVMDFKDAHWQWFDIPAPIPSPTHSDTIPQPIGITDTETEDGRPNTEDGKVPAPRVVVPPEAKQFLAMFYEPALRESQRKRYRDVACQIYDVLDPLHPGPKIRGGVRVKARSAEHLIDELKGVMKDPPIDRDLAIVWLLKRLLNAPKGPSVTEVQNRKEQTERNEEERYQREAKAAGVKWANENPAEYQKILASVEANYRGKTGPLVTIAKESQLTQKCSRAAGFPSFEQWKSTENAA